MVENNKLRSLIHLIDKLLDEFHGLYYFSKLGLSSRCHQVRIHDNDVERKTFRTHHGNYDVKVM